MAKQEMTPVSQRMMSSRILRVNTVTLREKKGIYFLICMHVSSFLTINVTRYISLTEYCDIIDTSWKYFTTEI